MTETATNEVRRVVESRLQEIKTRYNIAEISYRKANDDAMFPHVVFLFSNIVPLEHGRDDYTVDVHVFTRDDRSAWEIGDAVADLFSFWNAPQSAVLPTFYEANVFQVEDTDHDIAHVVVRITAQNYNSNAGGRVWQQ